jgi:NADPH2 dehydrogenase
LSDLFSEVVIRNIKIKNRIVMPPMVCFGFASEDGIVTVEHLKHYEARAKGGVGLIIIEATCVSENGRLAPSQLGLWSDDQIYGFSRIAMACHRYGAKVLVQIHHAGAATYKGLNKTVKGPSAIKGRSRFDEEVSPRALRHREIQGIQLDFLAAAARAKLAGLDGVELHGAHGYLISQFFSPFTNKRRDCYGGNIAGRTRFAAEIIKGIRNNIEADFIIGCRMGGDEPDLESSIEIARLLEQAGVDLLHISTGVSTFLNIEGYKPTAVPDGFKYNSIVYNGTKIKRKVGVPVIVVNGIRTPDQANYLIEQNLADFAAIGKGLMVDPEWANKARVGREVRVCLDCKFCALFKPDAVCPQIKSKKKKAIGNT